MKKLYSRHKYSNSLNSFSKKKQYQPLKRKLTELHPVEHEISSGTVMSLHRQIPLSTSNFPPLGEAIHASSHMLLSGATQRRVLDFRAVSLPHLTSTWASQLNSEFPVIYLQSMTGFFNTFAFFKYHFTQNYKSRVFFYLI